MRNIKFGLIAGFVFAVLDVVPMFFLEIPDRDLAIISAFINRLVMGLLIFTTDWKMPKWVSGLLIGVFLSLPYAIIAKTYGPILGAGLAGGLIIGFIAQRSEKQVTAN
jgi:hypothetical protein